ncbi:hypothetical protein FKP32DRAFT_1593656 [Trametes sanguinea]|nr:hypothetical protein FKP32DRAFT_1593656 [Trametes sanguinea]
MVAVRGQDAFPRPPPTSQQPSLRVPNRPKPAPGPRAFLAAAAPADPGRRKSEAFSIARLGRPDAIKGNSERPSEIGRKAEGRRNAGMGRPTGAGCVCCPRRPEGAARRRPWHGRRRAGALNLQMLVRRGDFLNGQKRQR